MEFEHPRDFKTNADSSIEFAVKGAICLGRILESQIDEDSSGANAKAAYEQMLDACCNVNILDFSQVEYVNSGAWPRFAALLRDLLMRGNQLRFVGLSGQPLKIFLMNKLDSVYPRYLTIQDALVEQNVLNPHAETTQAAAIARMAAERKEGRRK